MVELDNADLDKLVTSLAVFEISLRAKTWGFSSCVHNVTHGQNQAER